METSLSFSALNTAVHEALRTWSTLEASSTNLLSDLLLIRHERQKTPADTPTNRKLATNQILLNALTRLETQESEGAAILKSRYIENQSLLMVAAKHRLSEDQVKRRQRSAIQELTQIILDQETNLREAQAETQFDELPPPTYAQYLGMEKEKTHIVQALLEPGGPWILGIVGIGGIGKTSLADASLRTVIKRFAFQRVAWVRCSEGQMEGDGGNWRWLSQELLAKLQGKDSPGEDESQLTLRLSEALKAMPTIVVIDNLEATSSLSDLLEFLTKFANPSKFLLTTRHQLPVSSFARNVVLGQLSQASALALIRNQAKHIGIAELAEAGDDQLTSVFDTVGGNPLALKLVIGLAAVLPLPEILDDLTQAKSQAIEELYRHIYFKAWHTLSETSQRLLEIMPMAAEVGMKLDQMAAASQLSSTDLWHSITELVNHSLLEVRGSTWERRYGIHRLTASFLQTEIIKIKW